MRKNSEALPRTQLTPQAFIHRCNNPQSLDRHGIQEDDKADPNKSTALENKEAASSSSEALTSIIFVQFRL